MCCRWDGDLGCAECTEDRDSEEDVREVEALTIQVWLSCVTPVTNVTVLPVELMLLDSLKMAAYKEYMDLVHHLKVFRHLFSLFIIVLYGVMARFYDVFLVVLADLISIICEAT